MVKKIEGYVNLKVVDEYPTREHIGVLADRSLFFDSPSAAVTLTIHECEPERMFTASEVQAMMKELEEFQWFNQGQREYLKGRGIDLDETR